MRYCLGQERTDHVLLHLAVQADRDLFDVSSGCSAISGSCSASSLSAAYMRAALGRIDRAHHRLEHRLGNRGSVATGRAEGVADAGCPRPRTTAICPARASPRRRTRPRCSPDGRDSFRGPDRKGRVVRAPGSARTAHPDVDPLAAVVALDLEDRSGGLGCVVQVGSDDAGLGCRPRRRHQVATASIRSGTPAPGAPNPRAPASTDAGKGNSVRSEASRRRPDVKDPSPTLAQRLSRVPRGPRSRRAERLVDERHRRRTSGAPQSRRRRAGVAHRCGRPC